MLTFLLCCLPVGEMEAQNQQKGFQDPLSAAVAENERVTAVSLHKPAALETSGTRDSPTLSMNRQAADGSEDTEKAAHYDKNDATDSSSTWSPEVLHTHRTVLVLCFR